MNDVGASELIEPAVEIEPWMTVSDIAVRLRADEPGFLRCDGGWQAVVPHLLVAQPASRRVIDLPRLAVEPVPSHASPKDLSALLDRSALGSSPVVDGACLIGRLDHRRVRTWLASNARGDIAAELSQLRLATLAVLHDLGNTLCVVGADLDDRSEPGTREAFSQAVQLVDVLRSLHRGSPIACTSVDVGAAIARLLPLASALAKGVAHVEAGVLERALAHCPASLLERALISLVTNSREAMPPSGGVIHIEVQAVECEVRMRIRDTGPGVPNHLVGRLFERGFSTKKASAERGTGLASLREAALHAGGDLRYERGSSGAAFVLVLRRA